jgi:hypothetical protein
MSAIDNTVTDSLKLEMYILTPLQNSLSDYKAQLLEILYIDLEHRNQQQQLIWENTHSLDG